MNGGGCSQSSVITPVLGGTGVIQRSSTSSSNDFPASGLIISTESTTTITPLPDGFPKSKTGAVDDLTASRITPAEVTLPLVPLIDTFQVLPIPKFTCELCQTTCSTQLSFFEHLKSHYENVSSTSDSFFENDTKKRSPKKNKGRVDGGSEVIGTAGFCTKTDFSNRMSSKGSKKQVFSNTVKLKENDKNFQNVDQANQLVNETEKDLQSLLSPTKVPTKSSTRKPKKLSSPTQPELTCLNCKKVFLKKEHYTLHIACCQNLSTDHEENAGLIVINNTITDLQYGSQHINIPDKSLNAETNDSKNVDSVREDITVKLSPAIDHQNDDLDYDAYLDVSHVDDEEETEMMYLRSNICPSCDEHCETKESLDKHMNEVHPEIVDLFSTSGLDSKKKKTNSSTPSATAAKKPDVLKCQQCQRVFNHRNSLVYHTRSHTGERPYKCETCGKRFFATSALKVHKRLHSGEKPYTCEVCGRDFRQWGDLKYHKISIHTDDRDFQCEFCGKDFARKYSLVVHRRIHTGEKNYKCEYCSKSFRAASYLQNHRRIHTGEKPHQCEICAKAFRVRSDMKRHLASHKKEMKNLAVSVTNTAIAVTSIPTNFPTETDTKIIPVISGSNEISVLQTASVAALQQHLPVISTTSAPEYDMLIYHI